MESWIKRGMLFEKFLGYFCNYLKFANREKIIFQTQTLIENKKKVLKCV